MIATHFDHLVAGVRRALDPAGRPDRELLDRFIADRDPAAFEALVRRHGPQVLAVCRRVLPGPDADDAFQATFLALARDARRVRTAVGGWLVVVAHRVAVRQRAAERRRQAIEARHAGPTPDERDPSWREACGILHEELDRLPVRYREPLVLCYLRGQSRDEAAQALSCSVDVLRGNLERGRTRLGQRLKRRGITLSAGLLAAATAGPADAVLPSLMAAIVAGIQPAAAGLAFAWPMGLAVTLAACLVVGIAIQKDGVNAQPAAGQPKAVPLPPAKAAVETPKQGELAGRVVAPDGMPIAGAVVWLLTMDGKAKEAARSDADGRFTLPADDKIDRTHAHGGGRVHLAATKDGFGMALPQERFDADDLVLRLVKDDVPIKGRILDLQGKPVAGASVVPVHVWATPDDNLDDWLKAIRPADDNPRVITASRFRRKAEPPPGLSAVKSDTQGRFFFTGIGRERLLQLRVSGPSIATTEIDVLTRDMAAIRVQYDPGNSKFGQITYHGATFDFAADPTQPFEGTVTDKHTGKPIPRAIVRCDFPLHVEVTADEQGHYHLLGLPPGERRLIAAPPAGEPFLPRTQTGGRPNGEKPVTLDFALTAGVWIEGTVTDARSKKPVAGARLSYAPLDEEAVRLVAGAQVAFDETAAVTDTAGHFKVVALPGPGGIGIHGPGLYISAEHRSLQGDSLLWTRDGVKARWPRAYFDAFDALAVVQVDAKKPRSYAFTLDPGATVTGRVLDPDGKPLAGARASRLTEYSLWTNDPFPSEKFEVRQVSESASRSVLVWHEERKLGAVFKPKRGTEVVDVQLRPNGSAIARLLNGDGEPVADQAIDVSFKLPNEFAWCTWFPQMKTRTDAQGRLTLPNLPEGVEFSLRGNLKGPAGLRFYREFRVTSGKENDLGDLKAR